MSWSLKCLFRIIWRVNYTRPHPNYKALTKQAIVRTSNTNLFLADAGVKIWLVNSWRYHHSIVASLLLAVSRSVSAGRSADVLSASTPQVRRDAEMQPAWQNPCACRADIALQWQNPVLHMFEINILQKKSEEMHWKGTRSPDLQYANGETSDNTSTQILHCLESSCTFAWRPETW